MCNNQQHQKVLEEIKRLESVARNVPIVAVSDSDESDEESSMNFERASLCYSLQFFQIIGYLTISSLLTMMTMMLCFY